MAKKFVKVPIRGMTAEGVVALWLEGKLYLERECVALTDVEIKDNVRAYVGRIRSLATDAFRVTIDELWNAILDDNFYDRLIIPDVRTRKCRGMNKNGVMRIVGVLRSLEVYADISDSSLCAMLEQHQGDCSYRAYLGKGVEDNIRKELKKLARKFSASSF